MKKGSKIALLVAAVFCAAGLILCFVAWSSVDFYFPALSTADPDSYVVREESFAAADLDKIQLNIDVDDVQVQRSRDEQVHLTYTDRDNLKYYVTNQGGTLSVEQTSKKFRLQWFGFNLGMFNDSDCILELPAGFEGDVYVQNDVGDVTLADLALTGALDVQIGTGGVSSNGVTVKTATVQTDVGDIVCENWTVEQYLFLGTETGDFTLRRSTVRGQLLGETDVGEARLEQVTADSVDLTTETGDVVLEALAVSRFTATTDVGDVEGTIDGVQAEYTILVETEVGDSEPGSQKGTTEKEINITTEVGSVDLQFLK